MRKTAPVKMPMQTHETIMRGPLRDAWGISSIMCATESCDCISDGFFPFIFVIGDGGLQKLLGRGHLGEAGVVVSGATWSWS